MTSLRQRERDHVRALAFCQLFWFLVYFSLLSALLWDVIGTVLFGNAKTLFEIVIPLLSAPHPIIFFAFEFCLTLHFNEPFFLRAS